MNKKRTPSSYGRMYTRIAVVVTKPHDMLFMQSGWNMVSSDDANAVFEYVCSNRYAGDDESIVQSIWADLPDEVDHDCFKIVWENSVY